MIFKQWKQVLDGTKTQTRRPNFPYELARQLWKYGWHYPDPTYHYRPARRVPWSDYQKAYPITEEYIAEANHILARHVITQPGRGKKAVGRIRITKIGREKLQDISWQDALAEGIHKSEGVWASGRFAVLWDRIYRKSYRWEDNPEVWVLEFELAEAE